jgi:putative endonuclease
MSQRYFSLAGKLWQCEQKQVPHRRFAPVRNDKEILGMGMERENTYYVYIMASKSRVIYAGVTGSLMARVLRHRAGEGGAFTREYRVHRLVYYEVFHSILAAIERGTEIKKWRREKKVALICAKNPTWEDLAEGWGGPAVMRVSGEAGSSPGLRPRSE